MAKLTTSTRPEGEKKEFSVIPENALLNVQVAKCEIKPFTEDFRKKYNVEDENEVSFEFVVIDGDFAKRRLWGSAKPYFDKSDNCRLRIWTQEIMGWDSVPDGYEFDTDDLTGLNCRILVKAYVGNDGKPRNRVKEVLRAVKAPEDKYSGLEPF